jgi:hypothetical protein
VPEIVINSQGLGVMYKVGAGGALIDCDSWDNFFQSACWNPANPTVQATQTTVTNADGSTSAILTPATPANTDTAVPSFFCNFLDCDASGNLELDGWNAALLAGGAFAIFLLLKGLKL